MKKQYILTINMIVDGNIDDANMQNKIEYLFEEAINKSEIRDDVAIISTEFTDIIGNKNYGRCIKCGEWVSNKSLNPNVSQMSDGAIVNDHWYCDLCLPENHPNHF